MVNITYLYIKIDKRGVIINEVLFTDLKLLQTF